MKRYRDIVKVLNSRNIKYDNAINGMYANYLYTSFFLFIFFVNSCVTTYFVSGLLVAAIYLIIIFVVFFYNFMHRNIGIGVTKESLGIVRVSFFRKKEFKRYNIPFDKIRYLDVHKFLNAVSCKVHFIDVDGKFVKLKFSFNTKLIGSENFKKNSKAIYDLLLEKEKIIDRGDF